MKKLGPNQFQPPMGDGTRGMKELKNYHASKRVIAEQPRPKDVKAQEAKENKPL